MFDAVELITFDLDDTLWPCFPTIRAAEQALYEFLQQHAPSLTEQHDIDSLRTHRLSIAERHPEMAHNLTEVRLRSLQMLAQEHDLHADLPEAANAVFRDARNRVMPYDEVHEVLLGLRDRFVLVAVSNGNAQVEQTPLAGCFHHSFMAEQVGAAKPHPALFQAASRASGVRLDRALHVGDDPVRDIEAARQVGMRTVWVDREQGDWPHDVLPPDLQVGNLQELQGRLK
jgi:putative hydrolase of the HAD superfamily